MKEQRKKIKSNISLCFDIQVKEMRSNIFLSLGPECLIRLFMRGEYRLYMISLSEMFVSDATEDLGQFIVTMSVLHYWGKTKKEET